MFRGKSKHSYAEEIEPKCGWKNAGLLRSVAVRSRTNGEGELAYSSRKHSASCQEQVGYRHIKKFRH